ncbi:apyrase-like [Toxorhynchites rutilus septentrionalis]|uniref:apyrase-like n=1 Tax=Toxorhynchites rutilus septentrionalis TaxID=329112 RepID=UPI00247AB24A|nr:apyrase-like [Toxorhynchites rutilus septentrionalis]
MGTYNKWNKFCMVWIVLGCLLAVEVSATKNMPDDARKLRNLFPLTLVHINDFHARFEETNLKSNNCTATERSTVGCIAGISRVYTTIKRLLKEYRNKNVIYLNAGDNFQGTLWYNLLRWNVTAAFIKKLRPTVMTLGNHEFDHGPKGLAPYLKELDKANIPTVVANLELNGEKELKHSNIKKSVIFEIDGRKVGIIGVLYDKTHTVAQTGNVTFSNAIQAVKDQAQILRKRGIQHIIVLSHCGLDEDKKLATEAGELIDLIVGAHSHSFLYPSDSKAPYDAKVDVIEGDYPLLVKSKNSSKMTPVVQAKAFGKYVGRLTVYFDNDGNLKYWEGYPVYVDGSVEQDRKVEKDIKLWRKRVLELGSTVIGHTNVRLNRDSCRYLECSLGTVVADAFSSQWTNETFRPAAIIQAGNFRNPIYPGDITNGLVIEAAPFGSTVDLIRLRGQDIWAAAEHSFTWDDENRTNCLQVSGLRIRIDVTKPFYNRVVSIDVRNQFDTKNEVYQPLNTASEYYVAVPSYLADGKDGFAWMKNATSRQTGPLDSDAFSEHVAKVGVIDDIQRGRIQVCAINWDCKTNVALSLNEDGTPLL